MTALDFKHLWHAFSNEEIITCSKWEDNWRSDKAWTKFILGPKISSGKNSRLGTYLINKLGSEVGYRTEDGLVDLSLFIANQNYAVRTLGTNWELIEPEEKEAYPVEYLALVEIENSTYLAWQEMVKLTEFRAPLKVLVTYISNSNYSANQKRLEVNMLCRNFSSVLTQAHTAYPENPATEYLLIVGDIEQEQLRWHYFAFTSDGAEIMLRTE
jgi:hypothetical protein